MPEDKKKCRFYELQVGEEDENKPLRDVTYGNVWFRFTDITSAHGVPHIKNARGIFKLLVWCGAVMASIALLIIVVKPLIEKYLAFGVNVRVDVLYEPQITFPAVTVCNMNPIRYSQITKNDKLNDILGTPSTGTGDSSSISTSGSTMTPSPVETLTPAPSPTPTPAPSPTPTPTPSPTPVPAPSPTPTPAPSPTPTPTPSPSPTGRKRRNVDPSTDSTDAAVSGDGSGLATEESSGYGTGSGPGLKSTNIQPKSDGRQASANFELRNKVMKVLSEMSLEEKAPLGHQQDDFVLTCEYRGYDCLDYAFTTFYNNEYGNCFSFNSGWNSSLALETAFRPGPPNGLHITMNIDQDDYTGDLATSAGVRVIIHPQEKMPFPEDEGVSASPGQLTMIGVRKLTIHREGGDYGNCTDIQVHNYSRNVYEERYPVNYSSNACYKTCYQYNLMATCHCADMSYPLYGQAFAEFGNLNLENRTFDACDITNTNQTDCMTTVEDLFHNNELSCDCPQACDETSFITSVSTSYWPSDSYRSTLFEALASENEMVKHVLNSVDDPDKYQKNLLKVVVYFEEFNYEAISESPAYLIENLISDFGGILGLFLGFSVLTIIEVVELGLDVVILSCIKICCRGKKRDSVSPTPSEGHRMIVSTTHLHNDDLYATKNSAPPPYMHLPESKITPLA